MPTHLFKEQKLSAQSIAALDGNHGFPVAGRDNLRRVSMPIGVSNTIRSFPFHSQRIDCAPCFIRLESSAIFPVAENPEQMFHSHDFPIGQDARPGGSSRRSLSGELLKTSCCSGREYRPPPAKRFRSGCSHDRRRKRGPPGCPIRSQTGFPNPGKVGRKNFQCLEKQKRARDRCRQ